jgi:hypothetical protein
MEERRSPAAACSACHTGEQVFRVHTTEGARSHALNHHFNDGLSWRHAA